MSGWSHEDIPSQAGRTWAVTGANSGIGLVTARELARAGATVILGCRDPERGQHALEDVAEAASGPDPQLARLDLADLSSVRDFASVVSESVESLDGLVNNAGVMAPPREETADGFELQFGTNHLGHFALTGLVLDRLMAGDGEARVVTVSSMAHRTGSMDWDDLQGERELQPLGPLWAVQARQPALRLRAAAAARRQAAGESPAPRPIPATRRRTSSPRARDWAAGFMSFFNVTMARPRNLVIAQSDEMGALPSLYAATVPEVTSGAYVGPSGIGEARGHPQAGRLDESLALRRGREAALGDLGGADRVVSYPASATLTASRPCPPELGAFGRSRPRAPTTRWSRGAGRGMRRGSRLPCGGCRSRRSARRPGRRRARRAGSAPRPRARARVARTQPPRPSHAEL